MRRWKVVRGARSHVEISSARCVQDMFELATLQRCAPSRIWAALAVQAASGMSISIGL